jgi:hypothetical protein
MKILKTDNEVNLELAKIKLQSPTALKIKGYGDLYYDCGCGESHNINDDEILKFAAAPIIKLVLLCPKKFYTFINIKGFFKQTCITEWSASKNVFEKAILNLFPEWANEGKKKFNPYTLFYKN